MEERTLTLRFPGLGRIVWRFRGMAPLEHLAHLEKVMRVESGEEDTEPVLTEVTVVEGPSFRPEESNWERDRIIRLIPGISAAMTPKERIEIVLHPESMNQRMVFRLGMILHYGFLPLLLQRKVLLLHGALLAREGTGWVVTGPSGAGKSTCAGRVPPPWRALADDAVLVVRNGDGFSARGLPTWSSLVPERNCIPVDGNDTVRLSGIFQIIKSERDFICGVSKIEQSQILLHQFSDLQHMWGIRRRDLRRRMAEAAMDFSQDAVSQLTVGRLHCSLTGNFWEELEQSSL